MAVRRDEHTTAIRHKALEVNLDPLFYGSIAEIGAGQEVARQFFRAGGASGTVAKSVSAYDMQFSDAIYGPDESGRYVSESRLQSMLSKEFALVVERVADTRPAGSRFFAFADTVTAKRFGADNECHGWMGVKFQHVPGGEPCLVVLHVNMLDSSNLGQQEALGILGVNLVHAAYRPEGVAEGRLEHLMDEIERERLEVDYIHLDGPCFEGLDDRLVNTRLVVSGLGPLVAFGRDGRPIVPQDLLHGKDVLLLRGTFRPFTRVHQDMIELGLTSFAEELGVEPGMVAKFCEMNVARYLSEGIDEVSDLLDRVETITGQGHEVMVSSHYRYFRLGEYLTRNANRRVGFLLSVDNIYAIFDDRYYEGLEGGILEATGKLFASDSKLLVYPNLTPDGEVVTAENLEVPTHLAHLYRHLLYNRRIVALEQDRGRLVPFEGRVGRRRSGGSGIRGGSGA